MSLFTITKAVNASIERSVSVSALKHEQKMRELRLRLAEQARTSVEESTIRLNKARIVHSEYYSSLNEAQKVDYNECKEYLLAAINTSTPSA